ncbi:transposase [Halobacterium salinarum]|uniref:transposase n=1 Tax=Halobacterium salinarum TaxID=2242 RepID=UPI00298C1467|nr:transposase [Halobacterium salinarum]WJK64797.1 transposase [Halobacterium salinarum]
MTEVEAEHEFPSAQEERRRNLEALDHDFSQSNDDLGQAIDEVQSLLADRYERLSEVIGTSIHDVFPDDDTYSWSKYDARHVVRGFVYAITSPEIENFDQLARRLQTHPQEAQDLGFTPGETPSRQTLRDSWHDRFQTGMHDHIHYLAERAAIHAHNYGIEAESDHVRLWDTTDEKPDPDSISATEKQNAIDNIRPIAFDELAFDRDTNTSYDDTWFLDFQAQLSREQDFAQKNLDERHQNGQRAPSAATYFNTIETQDLDDWSEQFEAIYTQMIELAQGAGMLGRPVELMVDGTDLPFYGDPDTDGVTGTKKTKNTSYAYRHVTISARCNGRTVKLASFPLRDRSKLNIAVMALVRRARELVSVKRLYMDSEFIDVGLLSWLDRQSVPFIVQYRRTGKEVKRWLASLDGEAAAKSHTISPAQRSESLRVTMLAKRAAWGESDSDDAQLSLDDYDAGISGADNDIEGEWAIYVTNIENAEERPKHWAEAYANRWAIETNYRVIKEDFLAKTTSREFEVRLFYWLFAVMLYNAWVLLDVFLRADKPEAAPDDRPVMPAATFAKQFSDVEPG